MCVCRPCVVELDKGRIRPLERLCRGGLVNTTTSLPSFDRQDPLGLDAALSEQERAVRDTVRRFGADRISPYIADWFERGELPGVRELAKEMGGLGLLGMHLT